MIKKTLLIAGLLAQFAFAPAVFALSCGNPINAYDKTYCASLKMTQLDKEINDQYGKTIKVLTADQKKDVKKAQIQWIRARDSECSNGGTVTLDCVNDKMEKRISLLKSIERECKNSGCDKALLSKVE
ncbi:lysozyme inhibitor LprI family protein [Commensalibacter nepenthis]|uniref:Lysozyme inhibitor LprI family protein n=1 Tax=Commensalibacter nepenthis TaxID=3043872 RepID=A0ABT6Q4I8_9PROT|nr:lysozyme inhibitor LprI family protein [Commensalibacter sp. TBRC 10068]MDI2111812.1 lysozyme inhibitor LprI family protein [Commensalibacter sp. TBRC 10068]